MVGRKKNNGKIEKNKAEPKELTPWQIENMKYQKELAEQRAARLAEEAGVIDGAKETQKLLVTEEITTDEVAEKAVVEETDDNKWNLSEKGHKTFKLSNEEKLDKEIDESVKKLKELPKSISFADKLPKMKEKRKQRLKKRLIIIISLFATLVLLLLYYVSPMSKVRNIKVVGNDKVASERVVSSLHLNDQSFIWDAYFDEAMLKTAKEENQRINKIERKLIGINGLKIIVTEHADVAYLKEGENLYPVLDNGTIVKENTLKPENKYPVMIGFKEDKVLKAFAEKFYIISDEVKKNIKEIHSTPSKINPYLFTIYMDDGNEILASTRDYYEKLNYYPGIAAKMPENGLVDMEAGIFSKSYETIAAEEAAKKAEENAVKAANGEAVNDSEKTLKDQVTKENSVSGLGYDKWLEKLQEGDIEGILATPTKSTDESEEESTENGAIVEGDELAGN